MTAPAIACVSLLLPFIAWYAASSVVSWYRLRGFPGPLLARFSYLWIARASLSGRGYDIYRELEAQHGSTVMRIGPNELITSDPAMIRSMSAARSAYRRSSWYRGGRLDPYTDHMACMLDTAQHGHLKSITAAGYTGRDNPDMERHIDSQAAALVGLIQRKYLADDGEQFRPLDLGRSSQYFTLDVITRLAFGRELGHLDADSDVCGCLETMDGMAPVIDLCAAVPILSWLVQSRLGLGLFGPKPGDKRGIGKVMGLARETVAERYEAGAGESRDILGSLIQHGIPQRRCEGEVTMQIFAGSETTSTAIRVTMLYILATPSVYTRLRGEISGRESEGLISRPITNREAKGFPYLQAVIYEGLRLQPPGPGLMMKEVPPGGDTINGRFVPGGTRVGHNLGPAMHDKAVFGADAAVFRPERWLPREDGGAAKDGAALLRMRRQVDLVFGHGRWGCAGKDIALMELNKVFVELLRNFDFQLVYPQRPYCSRQHITVVQHGLWVRVSPSTAA